MMNLFKLKIPFGIKASDYLAINLLLLLSVDLSVAQQNDSLLAIEYMSQLNGFLRYSGEYSCTCSIVFHSPKRTSEAQYKIFSKGYDRALLVPIAPKKDIGKKMLLDKENIWFYSARTKRSILLNLTNSLFGNLSIGDILYPSIERHYKLKEWSVDSTHAKNKYFSITLDAKKRRTPYGKVKYYFNNELLVGLDAFARSGIHLKKAFFSRYRIRSDGSKFPTTIRLENAINPKYYSIITFDGISIKKDIPDYYFLPNNLELINE